MQKYQDVVIRTTGAVVAGASVLVQNSPAGTTATIYSDDGITVRSNPITTDANGRFSFYAADGRYNLVVTPPGAASSVYSDILLEDPNPTLTYSDTGLLASWRSSIAGYNQVVIQNVSNTPTASANYVVANSATTAVSGYAELGINSPSFAGVGPFNLPNAGYVCSVGADFAVGTVSSNTLRFTTNSVERAVVDTNGNLLVTNPAGLGYGTGAGGAITQLTNKATAVTLNRPTGTITTAADALAAGALVTFTFTNSVLAANDVLALSIVSGGTAGAYSIQKTSGAAGSCVIAVRNVSAGSLSEALVIGFAVLKVATT